MRNPRPNFGPGYFPGHPREAELRELVNKAKTITVYLQNSPGSPALWDTIERYARRGRALSREMYDVDERDAGTEVGGGPAADVPSEDA